MTSRPARSRSAGVTLLELLLVLAILGIVLGAGAGLFASLDLGRRQARGVVKNVLRAAQNSAIARAAPARVRLDREANALHAEALEVVGTWQFERRSLAGARGLVGTPRGGVTFEEDGFLGAGLFLDGRVGTRVEVPLDGEAAWDPTRGFSVSLALRREDASGGQVVVLGDAIAIDVTARGEVRGWFVPRAAVEGREGPGGRVLVASPPGAAEPGAWTRVELEYDRRALVLSIDGVPVASVPETAPVWPPEGPLLLSGRRHPFRGTLDALVVGVVAAGETVVLPETVRLGADTPDEVVFAPGGGLDRERHPQPVVLTLEHEDGTRDRLLVGTYGTVDG